MKTPSPFAVLAGALLCPFPAPAADPQPIPGAWTLVSIPDTQHYVTTTEGNTIFAGETQWLADNTTAWNIRFVAHVGDLVDDNNDTQWTRARTNLDTLNGIVPFALCTGNHDCGPGGNGQSHASEFSDPAYFGPGSPYTSQPTFRGNFAHPADGPDNFQSSWHTFTVGHQPFLVLTAEWGPRDAVVAWLSSMAAAHPFHRVILVVHAYLENGSSRFDWSTSQGGTNPHAFDLDDDPDGTNDGEDLWNGFVRLHRNVCLVLCGHSGRAYRQVTGDHGNAVHEMLYNTQNLPNGGNGFLRLLQFLPDGRTVRALTYSSHLDEWVRSSSDEFEFFLDSVSTTDSDGDDLPDWFESNHQFNPAVNDARDDADGDGRNNHEEFLAATDPRDPADLLKATEFERTGGSLEVRWKSVPGMRYEVESNAGLDATGWMPEMTLTADDLESVASFPVPASRRFVRVRVD